MITEIAEGIWLGTEKDALAKDEWDIIIDVRKFMDFGGVDESTLKTLVDYISLCRDRELRTLVHCNGGAERSPLVMAYWLYCEWNPGDVNVRNSDFFEKSYNIIVEKHPITRKKSYWIRWVCEWISQII